MAENIERIFEYNGMPVAYRVTGNGPPLLILHGWGSSSRVMMPLGQALGDIRTCYIPDLPGFGATPPPKKPWAVDDYVELTRSFAGRVIGGPTDILAHSFGGRITLKWAAREGMKKTVPDGEALQDIRNSNRSNEDGCEQEDISELLQKIIITGGAGMRPKRSYGYYRRRSLAMLLKAPFAFLPSALKNKAMTRLRATDLWKSLGSTDYRKLDGIMREIFVKTVSEHLEHCLPVIPHEVLLLWGKEDKATPWYQGERMEKGLENGALVGIERAGHYAFLDQPDRFQRIVRAFLTAQ
ncbi:MAG: alpha/beta hydrolase [Cyclonatronaceae bacterium]